MMHGQCFIAKIASIVIVVLFCIAFATTHGYFGQFCNERISCGDSKHLTCTNSTCHCNEAESLYDETSKICRILATKSCRSTQIDEFDEDQFSVDNDHEDNNSAVNVQNECVANATCNQAGICVCQSGFGEIDGLCLEIGGFGSKCHTDFDCKPKYLLSCLHEVCACDPTMSVWSSKSQQCVGLATRPCMAEKCITDAFCKHAEIRNPAAAGICECYQHSKVTNRAGLCTQIEHGGDCDVTQGIVCHTNFTCINYKCHCKSRRHQEFDSEAHLCRNKVGAPCEFRRQGGNVVVVGECIAHSTCVRNERTNRGQCECDPGFVGNYARECAPAYGSKCKNNGECDGALSCRDGKCDCEDDLLVFDEKKKKCVGRIGAFCDRDYACVENSSCVMSYGQSFYSTLGHCEELPW